MRIVVQRVTEAEVSVAGDVIGRIGRGLLLLVGCARDDDEAAAAWLARKIAGLRVFADDAGLMNADLAAVRGQVLAVPQFTLLGDCRKGNRPSFANAMEPGAAALLFDRFVAHLATRVGPVPTGRFGAAMQVRLTNDGPVTLILER
jgi:D-tyrosyl-tRNA(Tyr) deacylase